MNPRRSSSVTVLSRDSQKPGMSKRKRLLIIGAVVVLAAVGVAVGVVVSKDSSDSSSTASGDNSSKSSGSSTSGTSTNGGTSTSTDSTSSSTGSSSNNTSTTAKITSDPTKATLSLAAFAIGDWGSTVEKDSCCSDDSSYTDYDVIAEDVVAKLMNIQAGASGAVKPKVIMGHGDNFYWSGINGDSDATYRFTNTFEKKFAGANLADIPWVNVMGNHDYGGSSFVCTKGGEMAECADQAALIAAIDSKFSWQAKYVSPNGNRWIMEDHFYVHSIKDDASGVSIDIFNVDTNDADSHGAQQICCQCYGYAAGDDSKCSNVVRGDKYCAGGSTDMYDACIKQLTAWGDDSRKQLAEKVKASKATWKIVNSHYSPYNHYAADRQDMWKELLDGLGVQIWMNGHTHGEKHDHASFGVHFIENGAGGGILNEAASGIPPYVTYLEKVWTYANHDYGFFELSASEEWMKVRFLTFDDKWNIADDFKASTLGGVADHHCWYIPVDGSLGKSCDKTK